MKSLKALSLVLLCLSSLAGAATTETPAGGMTVNQLGVSSASAQAFFNVPEAPASARGCANAWYYVDLSTTSGRLIYSTLLTAQASSRKLARIDWASSGSPVLCYVSLVQLLD